MWVNPSPGRSPRSGARGARIRQCDLLREQRPSRLKNLSSSWRVPVKPQQGDVTHVAAVRVGRGHLRQPWPLVSTHLNAGSLLRPALRSCSFYVEWCQGFTNPPPALAGSREGRSLSDGEGCRNGPTRSLPSRPPQTLHSRDSFRWGGEF